MKKTVCIFISVIFLMTVTSCGSRKIEPVNFDSFPNTTEENQNLESNKTPESNPTQKTETSNHNTHKDVYLICPKNESDTIPKQETENFSHPDHETVIPESVPKPNANFEPTFDVSAESIETLIVNYFETPEDELSQDMLYYKLKEMYLSAEWDGISFNVNEHVISISSKGYIVVDNFFIGNHAEPLDLPKQSRYYNGVGIIDDCNIQYVPGKGSYILIDDMYMLYLRGEKIPLDGEPLNWKELDGVDVDYGHAILHYVDSYDIMFLTTPMKPSSDGTYSISEAPYLYIFPDYNVSKINLIAQVEGFIYDGSDIFYTDLDGALWKYRETVDGYYYFEFAS